MNLWTAIACLFGITVSLWSGSSENNKGNLPQVVCSRRLTRRIPLVNGNDIQFRHLRAPLSQTHVGQIVQDRKGFLWFGTQDGLNRYDGYDLKVFRHDPNRDDSLSGVLIVSLLEDRTGGLWIGSDEFLDRFDPISEKFTRYEFSSEAGSLSGAHIYYAAQDASGLIWLCTRSGLYSIDPMAHQTKFFRHDPSDPSTLASNAIYQYQLLEKCGITAITKQVLNWVFGTQLPES